TTARSGHLLRSDTPGLDDPGHGASPRDHPQIPHTLEHSGISYDWGGVPHGLQPRSANCQRTAGVPAPLVSIQHTGLSVARTGWQDESGRRLPYRHYGGVLAEVLPELALILRPQPQVPPLGFIEAQHRFIMVIQNFLAVLATPEQPLVVFLDDLQWDGRG